MAAVQVDYTAACVGVGGYALYRIAQYGARRFCKPPPKKVVEDDDADVQKSQRAPNAVPKNIHSVLPSSLCIKLAVFVAAVAAAGHLGLSLLPFIPGLMMLLVSVFVKSALFPDTMGSSPQTNSQATPTTKTPATKNKDAANPASPKKLNSVLPSPTCIKLAVFVASSAAFAHRGVSLLPFVPALIMLCVHLFVKAAFFPSNMKVTAQPPREGVSRTSAPAAKSKVASKQSTPAKLNSVLPSPTCIKLAVFVAISAAFAHLGLSLLPVFPALIMLCVHFFVKTALFPEAALVPATKTKAASKQSEETLKRPKKNQLISQNAVKGKTKLNSVLPSALKIQLATIVSAWAAATHLDMPLEPRLAGLVMYCSYRLIFFFFAPMCASPTKAD